MKVGVVAGAVVVGTVYCWVPLVSVDATGIGFATLSSTMVEAGRASVCSIGDCVSFSSLAWSLKSVSSLP